MLVGRPSSNSVSMQGNKELHSVHFTQEGTNKVVMELPGKESRMLERKEEGWVIKEFKVSSLSLKTLVQALNVFEVVKLVSRNPSHADVYGITPAQGVRLIMDTEQEKNIRFLIGKQGPEPLTFYIQKEGLQAIYLVKGELRSIVTKPFTYWRDKPIATIVVASPIRKVVWQEKKVLTTMSKNKDGLWEAQQGKRNAILSSDRMERFFKTLRAFQGTDIATEIQEKNLTKANRSLTLNMSGEENKTLLSVQFWYVEDSWFVRREGESIVYAVADTDVHNLLPTDDIFSQKK